MLIHFSHLYIAPLHHSTYIITRSPKQANAVIIRQPSLADASLKQLCKSDLNIVRIKGVGKEMATTACCKVSVSSASQIGSEKLTGRKRGSDTIINLLTCSLV